MQTLTDERVQELTTDLYYDLLDKYVQLLADYRKVRAVNKKLLLDNSAYLEACSKPDDAIKAKNKQIDICIKVIKKHIHNPKGAILELQDLK